MPNSATVTSGPLVVAIAYDGLCTFEFGIAAEVFGLARPEMGETWYRFASAALEKGVLRAQGGLSFTASGGLELLALADLIVIPGWRSAIEDVPKELCRALQDAHSRGARIASICSGAFVLAEAGLLNGAVATTHWRYADSFRRRYPRIPLDDSSLYRRTGRVYTSAGSAAGLDLMIAIVREDFGADAANSVARRLVIAAHRTGDQAQFLERPVPRRAENRISPMLERIQASLQRRWSVSEMAQACGMSNRTFQRQFEDATGMSPSEWLVRARIEAAKDLLANTRLSVEQIAETSGFGTAFTLRHHFRRLLTMSPTQYRAAFSEHPDGAA